ncbi:hypothetical protein ACIPSE_43205 [Streptomyces sp. NPDC090106]|uniref:hypothetical protein n=1 Tax=Streptomyces sp. NPDC090106 TaxID=3365946 RepID=UPI003813B11D
MTTAQPRSDYGGTPHTPFSGIPRHLRFGQGTAILDPVTGAPVQFVDDAAPERRFLLDDEVPWHHEEHQWGSGHLVTDRGAGRWLTPVELHADVDDGVRAVHTPLEGVRLTVVRRGTAGEGGTAGSGRMAGSGGTAGSALRETYTLTNTGRLPLTVTGFGIQTPFADLYADAESSLGRQVHAHLFTGGTWAWALAVPMSGEGDSLGLIVRQGALWAYAVESRNKDSLSDARGHLSLLVTDHARNPSAFGGQPSLRLAPGESSVLEWELGWYADQEHFLAATNAPASLSAYATETGRSLHVDAAQVTSPEPDVRVIDEDRGHHRVECSGHGTRTLELNGGRARTEVLFHLPLEEVVRRRASYIVRHHRAGHRTGLLGHAFVPVDTRTLLSQPTNGWADWSDGSERIAMPLLLQHALAQGWTDPDEIRPLLDGWATFARTHLLDATGAPCRGSGHRHLAPRLYDAPWLAQFFDDRHRLTGDPADLDQAARIMERAGALGSGRHLSLMASEVSVSIATALDAEGEHDRAGRLRAEVVTAARHFTSLGRRLPGHEVSYEQSMVAPLLDLLIDAFALTGDQLFHDALAERLPWLLAFGGPQPHARLHGVPLRHWDGYWFGANRQWGDVFPHYWSALTATTLLRLPPDLRTPDTDRLAESVLRANMANYGADGSATCAFVMPSTVDGRPAHRADPLANDQDWHLVLWLRAERARGGPVVSAAPRHKVEPVA